MPARKKTSVAKNAAANLGFEAKLWLAADKLRNNMDAAEPERSGDSQPQAARRASRSLRVKYISDIFRRALIEIDPVNCMAVLLGQPFYSMQIPVCLWFPAKFKNAGALTFDLN